MKTILISLLFLLCTIARMDSQSKKMISKGYYQSFTYEDVYPIVSEKIFEELGISVLVYAETSAISANQYNKKVVDAALLLTTNSKLIFIDILKNIQPLYNEWIAGNNTSDLVYDVEFKPIVIIPTTNGFSLQDKNIMKLYFRHGKQDKHTLLAQISAKAKETTSIIDPHILNFSFQSTDEINDFIKAIDELYCSDNTTKTQ